MQDAAICPEIFHLHSYARTARYYERNMFGVCVMCITVVRKCFKSFHKRNPALLLPFSVIIKDFSNRIKDGKRFEIMDSKIQKSARAS